MSFLCGIAMQKLFHAGINSAPSTIFICNSFPAIQSQFCVRGASSCVVRQQLSSFFLCTCSPPPLVLCTYTQQEGNTPPSTHLHSANNNYSCPALLLCICANNHALVAALPKMAAILLPLGFFPSMQHLSLSLVWSTGSRLAKSPSLLYGRIR